MSHSCANAPDLVQPSFGSPTVVSVHHLHRSPVIFIASSLRQQKEAPDEQDVAVVHFEEEWKERRSVSSIYNPRTVCDRSGIAI